MPEPINDKTVEAGVRSAAPIDDELPSIPVPKLGGSLDRLPTVQAQLQQSIRSCLRALEDAIGKGSWVEARQHVGAVGIAQTQPEDRKELLRLVRSMPESERAVANEELLEQYWATDLIDAYGANVLAMTKAELTVFAKEVATGRLAFTERADPSDVISIMKLARVSTTAREDVLRSSVEAMLSDVVGKVSPACEKEHMLQASIKGLGELSSETSAAFLVKLLTEEIVAGRFKQSDPASQNPIPASIVLEVTDAIESRVRRNPLEPQLFLSLGQLKKAADALKTRGNENDAFRSLEKTIELMRRTGSGGSLGLRELRLPKDGPSRSSV